MQGTHQLRFRVPGGVTLSARAWGDAAAPSVLLLHGMAQSNAMFDSVGPALAAAGRYAIALDLRGHGESDDPPDQTHNLQSFVDDLLAVLQQLPSRPAIIGASLGGKIAMVTLGESSDALASSLIVIDTTPWIERDVARVYSERVGQSGRNPWRLVDSSELAEADTRIQAATAKLRLPVLLVRGQDSDLVTAESARRFVALGDNFAEFDIAGAGHFVAADRAETLNAVVLEFLERVAPRHARDYVAGSDLRTLRDALGIFPTGVTVATTRSGAGEPIGITVNSFTSVSLDPPLLLFCPAKSSQSHNEFILAPSFAVNVLHIGQQPTSTLFASRSANRFADTKWETWTLDVPILTEASAIFECRRHAVHDAGDHSIVIGEVVRARFEPWRDPLIYFRGKYRRLHFD